MFTFDFSNFDFHFQYYWWIIQCNECTTTQIDAGGCEQDFTFNFLEFDIRIRIRSPSSLITIQYYWWIAMSGLLLRVAMCVPMHLFEHHLACDLVRYRITKNILHAFLTKHFWKQHWGWRQPILKFEPRKILSSYFWAFCEILFTHSNTVLSGRVKQVFRKPDLC